MRARRLSMLLLAAGALAGGWMLVRFPLDRLYRKSSEAAIALWHAADSGRIPWPHLHSVRILQWISLTEVEAEAYWMTSILDGMGVDSIILKRTWRGWRRVRSSGGWVS